MNSNYIIKCINNLKKQRNKLLERADEIDKAIHSLQAVVKNNNPPQIPSKERNNK